MKAFILVLLAIGLCDARPSLKFRNAKPQLFRSIDSFIIGGSNAGVGAYPWQLSQERLGGGWGHSCGASLLTANTALSAAHCVDGAGVNILRCVAGINDRSNPGPTAQYADLSAYRMHEQYNQGGPTFANDIAVLFFANGIAFGANVAPGTLPPDNNNNFAGNTVVITGWGRTDGSNNLPNVLQQANVQVLTTDDCQNRVAGIAQITDNHICVYGNNFSGACNGDSGGPMNCPGGPGFYVCGVTSFVIADGGGNCLVAYPSFYTRTSPYLGWIGNVVAEFEAQL